MAQAIVPAPVAGQTEDHRLAKIRHYWLTALLAGIAVIAVPQREWTLTVFSHTLLEVVASTLAFVVGCLALVRHFSRRSGRFLFIGVGFLGTAFFDTLHTVVSLAKVPENLPASFESITLWSWLASRVFLGMLLVMAAFRIRALPDHASRRETVPEGPIFISVAVMLVFCFILFWTAPLPGFIQPEALLARPLELVPTILFLLAFVVLYRSRAWHTVFFVHWLMLALIVNVAVDGFLLLFANQLFNGQAAAAHILKIAAYGLVFAGLAHSLFELVRQVEQSATDLEATNVELQRQIEERHQAEAQLRMSELRLAEAQRLARLGYWEMEPEARRLRISTELSAILGLPARPHTLALADMLQLVGASERTTLETAFENAVSTLQPFDAEVEITPGAGTPVRLFVLGNAVGDGEGRAVRLWGTGQDVTERYRAEEQLRVIAARLEASNRELQDFAYIASHDLQEPLRKIIAFSDRLTLKFGDVLDETGHDYIQRVTHAARRMQTLIEDLLTLSRVTTRGQPFVAVALDDVVSGVASDLETLLEETDGRLELGPLPVVEADPLQMRQLFQNLIGNGLKFHRTEAPPVVRVYAEEEGAGGNNLCRIIVEDTGIGFDMKYADRIFQPFQRLHGRSSQFQGTGMGLAICRKIVERHHGLLTAESAPEAGARFVVELPATQPA